MKKIIFTAKRFIYIGFLSYFIPIFLGYLFDLNFHVQHFAVSFLLSLVIFAFATLFILTGIFSLTKHGKGTINPEMPPQKLAQKGIYAYIRHPIYFGWILVLFAFSLFYGSLSLLIISIFLIPFIHLHAVKEEKQLMKRFGKAYVEYKKKVPRWIPRLKK